MWRFLSGLPTWAQVLVTLFGLPVALWAILGASFLGVWLAKNDPYRGVSISLGPVGFQISERKDPGLAKCEAASKALSDLATHSAKTVSDLIAAESSDAERVAVLRRKYIDGGIVDSARSLGWVSGQRYSHSLSDTETEFQKIAEARQTAQKQQADLLAKVNEINRLCGSVP
jgi:hypothetical protein